MERKELDFFLIDNKYYGGDQSWHDRYIMNKGGCSAVSACEACIFLAKTQQELKMLYPYDADNVNKTEFLHFFEIMFEFIHPGIGGLTNIKRFSHMLECYVKTMGAKVDIAMLSGDMPYEQAENFVIDAVDNGLPVMYLMLSHSNFDFDEYEWHWFTLTGYEKTCNGIDVIFATWGCKHSFSLKDAWDTRKVWRGGMVCIRPN